ncbi:TIGR02450 family Trp-rich protein [Pseudomonas putida]
MNAVPHRLNPSKLLLSKWTAVQPKQRENHFLVTALMRDEEGTVIDIELQAVLTGRTEQMPWQALREADCWLMGWR